MANKILLVFLAFDFLFACCGGLILGAVLMTRAAQQSTQTVQFVAQNLLLDHIPMIGKLLSATSARLLVLTVIAAAGVNALFIFATFLLSVPAIVFPTHRTFLRIHGYAVVFCALFSLTIGLIIWFSTLKTKSNLSVIWFNTPDAQSLLQQKFKCCGYFNATSPPFIIDDTCPNSLVANSLGGCVDPFSTFANAFLDLPFTAAFGIAGIDILLLLSAACLFKDRKEKERYQRIDAKSDMPI